MGGLVLGLLLGYIIGGLSFVPLLAYVLWTWGTRTPSSDTPTDATSRSLDNDIDTDLNGWGTGLGEDLLRELKAKHVPDVAAGYFAVCRDYVPGGVNGTYRTTTKQFARLFYLYWGRHNIRGQINVNAL